MFIFKMRSCVKLSHSLCLNHGNTYMYMYTFVYLWSLVFPIINYCFCVPYPYRIPFSAVQFKSVCGESAECFELFTAVAEVSCVMRAHASSSIFFG